jgi:hypothetical protein
MKTFTTRQSDDINSMEYLNRALFNVRTDPEFRKNSSKYNSKLKSLKENNSGCIDKLKCLNILTKLENYSTELDTHLNLFSQLDNIKERYD